MTSRMGIPRSAMWFLASDMVNCAEMEDRSGKHGAGMAVFRTPFDQVIEGADTA